MSISKPSLRSVSHCDLPPWQVASLCRVGKHHPNQSVKASAKCLADARQTPVNTKLFFCERLKIQPFTSVTPAAGELPWLCPVRLCSFWVCRAKPKWNFRICLSRHIRKRIWGSYSHWNIQALSTAWHRRVRRAAGRGERLHKNNPPANSAERR